MDKRFWAIIGIIIAIFVGFMLINNNSHKPTTSASGTTSHYTGDLNSKVTFLEYGDYECPVCASFFPITQQVEQKYASTVRFQFRNLPLTSIHPNAFASARAAEAADLQGKFWQMHDLIYENQDPNQTSGWVVSKDPLNDYFVKFAQQLGLNVTKFKADFASSAVNNRINADTAAFNATGQQMATPTYFLNGKKLDNSTLIDASNRPSLAAFSKAIDAALAAQK